MAALGGVVGPGAFAAAWVIGGATKAGYSPVHDAISRLAAIGSSTRPLMTGGFIAFGLAVPVYATALRRFVDGPAWITAAATGISTLAVAAAPLEHSTTLDHWHAVFAGLGYVTLAATPLLAARPLAAAGHRNLARFGVAAGVVSAISLALTTSGAPTGLFQRLGLSAGDVWLAASGIAIAAGELGRSGRSSRIFH
ncbi:MAG: hypothetical protein JWN62_4462 [Acidimicrobiales bacterium]|nr:hypothetical protein [Acidimicrobiales bacterium]